MLKSKTHTTQNSFPRKTAVTKQYAIYRRPLKNVHLNLVMIYKSR